MEHEAFVRLMQTVADAWNAGDTERALACFADDAVYMEPPDEQWYEGRAELSEFFGGEDPPPMHMQWHQLVVDGDVGAGEYTYRGTNQYHGLVIVPATGRGDRPLARVSDAIDAAVRRLRRAEPLRLSPSERRARRAA